MDEEHPSFGKNGAVTNPRQDDPLESITAPDWAGKYSMPMVAAYWFDQFARRARPSFSMLNGDDYCRLKKFLEVMDAERKSITRETIVEILTNEYHFYERDALYVADEIIDRTFLKQDGD